jgi:hypothetical protein
MGPGSLTQFEMMAKIAETFVTVTAIIIGSLWSYAAFIRNRLKYPKTKIEHKVSSRPVADGKQLLSVDITLANIGEILVTLDCWEINVKQVLPPRGELRHIIDRLPGDTGNGNEIIQWHTLVTKNNQVEAKEITRIEPGEFEQLHYDFLLNSEVKSILIESYFQTVRKRGRYTKWGSVTIHDISYGMEKAST